MCMFGESLVCHTYVNLQTSNVVLVSDLIDCGNKFGKSTWLIKLSYLYIRREFLPFHYYHLYIVTIDWNNCESRMRSLLISKKFEIP